MTKRWWITLALSLVLSGCAAPTQPLQAVAPSSSVEPTSAVPTWTFTEPTPMATPNTSTTSTPHKVRGVVLVNRQHRLRASYVPAWSNQQHGLHPDVLKAANQLMAAAKKDGLHLEIRSGYRSYATQDDSFKRAMKTLPPKIARSYYAEAGTSEHQTGLAIDFWDGSHRGDDFARLPQSKWLAAHAHEYGFIIRYPQGKQHITGYAWEPWHVRYVGTEVSRVIGPDPTLTLEEFLGTL